MLPKNIGIYWHKKQIFLVTIVFTNDFFLKIPMMRCIECESPNLCYDYARAEIYCKNCGLVLIANNNANETNLFDRYLWEDFILKELGKK